MKKEEMMRGFSLVELSIVLVILGLLTGGILAGQSLIRAAELRSVSTEYTRYVTAMQTFRDKYFALPGDMNNAISFWGRDTTTCGFQAGAAGTPGSCNGGGNGRVGNWAVEEADTEYELWHAWRQLALAGLIEGSFTAQGVIASNYRSALGSNVPRSKLSNAGWSFTWLGNFGDAVYFTTDYGNVFFFGAQSPTKLTYDPALKAEEAWNIDTKMDDGLPHTGKVFGFKTAFQPNCVAASNIAYNLTATATGCGLAFIPGL